MSTNVNIAESEKVEEDTYWPFDSKNYFNHRLIYLMAEPAFRKHPITLTMRTLLWCAFCAMRVAPRFRVSPGVWFKVDPVMRHSGSSSAFILRDWAEPELRYLDSLLALGDTFIDCGANIGIYTVRGAAIVGRSGKVVAVEPGRMSFMRLQRNVRLNGFDQVAMVNKAVSETSGSARLYHADAGPVSFSLVPKAEAEFEEVRTTTIDSLVEGCDLNRVDCIKLDVEGVEGPVLRGAREVLSRFKPTLIFERTSPGQRRQIVPEDLVSIVHSFGYRIYQYVERPPSKGTYRSPNLVGIHPDSRKSIPDFLEPWNAVER